MVPALAFALVVVGSAIALTFDRLWQDAAAVELRTAGEAAALAAACQLASDDTLKKDADWAGICQSARDVAVEIADQNFVGGVPVRLDVAKDGDVRLGQMIPNSIGEDVFVETEDHPRTVVVRAWQGRGSRNPVGLLVRDLTGAGRLMEFLMVATAENRIEALRPYEGVNVPALPIAICAGNVAMPGWSALIEKQLGPDTCGWNAELKEVEQTADGLPEMTAFSVPQQADQKQQLLATLHLIDIGAGLSDHVLAEQCRNGWSQDDLAKWDGELPCDGRSRAFTSKPKIPAVVRSELSQLIGEVRICWLFETALPTANSDQCQLSCARLVAVRILDVQSLPDGMFGLQVQPAVITTRTAVVSRSGDDSLANPYVYKVYLSH